MGKKTMNIRPLPGWVLLEEIKEDDATASGIKLPESSQDVPMKGKVIEIGIGSLVEPAGHKKVEIYREYIISRDLFVGAIVLFKKYSGQTIKHEGREYKLVRFDDLLAIIE